MSGPDLSEFQRMSEPPKRRKPCAVAPVLERLGEKDRELLEAAFAADKADVSHAGIEKWLVSRGHAVKWQTVRNHRDRSCSCYG